jgi:hypothetical protein
MTSWRTNVQQQHFIFFEKCVEHQQKFSCVTGGHVSSGTFPLPRAGILKNRMPTLMGIFFPPFLSWYQGDVLQAGIMGKK